MPYIGQCSTLSPYCKATLPSSTLDTLSPVESCAGGNITTKQADVPCRELNEEDLCRSLAALIGLHEDTIQTKRWWIRSHIHYFRACNFDFGLAYAAARVAWKHFNDQSVDPKLISIHRAQWHKYAKVLEEARTKAIEIDHSISGQELIITPYSIMPRRLWDLKSNRVVDFRMLHAAQSTIETPPTFWAVSHSWTNDMCPVLTMINQHQWPVPLPNNITLDCLRSDLLTLGAEYVWLDVVCLRQQSGHGVSSLDQVKTKEWKLDVPTIGNIYRRATNIVRYFNGLGIPFSNNGWDDERHWLQRAWTLQDIATENTTINGGIPRDQGQVFLNSRGKVSGKVTKLRAAIRPVIQLAAQVDGPRGCEIYELAREMTKRYASQPVDKLLGLFYLLRTTKLPCYDEKMTSEDFWRQCFHLLPAERKAEILFDFPYRGSEEQWFPTWAQMLKWPIRDPEYEHTRPTHLSQSSGSDLISNIPGDTSFFIRSIWTIPDAVLHDETGNPGKPHAIPHDETGNLGEYKVEFKNRLFGFYTPYLLQEYINVRDQRVFTLAIADLGHTHNWVVCRAIEKRVRTDVEGPGGGRRRRKRGIGLSHYPTSTTSTP